jgi:hypothetical protein
MGILAAGEIQANSLLQPLLAEIVAVELRILKKLDNL